MTTVLVSIVVFLALFVAIPIWLTRRRNNRAEAKGRPMTDEVKGAGHGFRAAGTVVHFLARWRVFTLPAVALLGIVGIFGAFRVGRVVLALRRRSNRAGRGDDQREQHPRRASDRSIAHARMIVDVGRAWCYGRFELTTDPCVSCRRPTSTSTRSTPSDSMR